MRKKVQTKIDEEVEIQEVNKCIEIVDLLKQIVNQNEQVIQLLTKIKERFI